MGFIFSDSGSVVLKPWCATALLKYTAGFYLPESDPGLGWGLGTNLSNKFPATIHPVLHSGNHTPDTDFFRFTFHSDF